MLISRYRPFVRLVLGLLSILTFGTLGYIVIEGDWSVLEALYMTVITITTIGFGEVQELSAAGRVFTILVIFLGISLAASLFARLGQFVVESGIKDLYGRRRMNERIRKMRNHYLLCGFGRTGSAIARRLAESGVDFVVIDSSEVHVADAGTLGYCVLQGDAASDTVLIEAGIDRAAGTVLCVGDDSTNVNIALAARELNTEQSIIARGDDPSLEYRLIRAGADTVVNPMRMGGEQIARVIVDEHRKVLDKGEEATPSMLGYELHVVRNTQAPRQVKDFLFEHRAQRPVAIRRADGSMSHNPLPDDLVGENESLLLLIHEEKKNRAAREMRILTWADDLSIGLPKIDKEHRRLYKYAEELQTAVVASLGSGTINRRYGMFVTYAAGHFHREEVLMRESLFPDLEKHRIEHEEITKRISGLSREGRFQFSDDTWNQIDRWLSQHFLESDRLLSEYLKSQNGRLSPLRRS